MNKNITEYKTISLPKLNNLEPNLESTALKLMEEAGELAQIIGKFRGLNGECSSVKMDTSELESCLASELLDVAQVAISMMFVLEEEYGTDIPKEVEKHINKLKEKEYIK